MAMEWDYTRKPPRWTLNVGPWRATVERLPRPRNHWAARIEHGDEQDTRYDGPLSDDPMLARSWCITKIAELRVHMGRS